MNITILTLFPELFNEFKKTSIIKLAIEKKILNLKIVNFRDYSKEKHKKVDAPQIGGGNGMVLQLQPIVDCLRDIKKDNSRTYLMSPSGFQWDQKSAINFSKYEDLILVCGHYEGFDERLNDYVDGSISIGNYILTGGEVPSMVITESITRLLENVITKGSLDTESFDGGLLDYPAYAKPNSFEGKEVPKVLLSGNHKEIEKWRNEKRIENTKSRRSDLFRKIKYLKDFNFYFKLSDGFYNWFHNTNKSKEVIEYYYTLETKLSEILKKWKLKPIKAFDDGWLSVTLLVKRGGNNYVLKYPVPYSEAGIELELQINALKECNGKGLPKVYEHDSKTNAILIEYIKEEKWENKSSQKLSLFLKQINKIHNTKIKNKFYLNKGIKAFYDFLGINNVNKYIKDKLWLKAYDLAIKYVKRQVANGDFHILHGDVHEGNFIYSKENSRFIDPHGFIGLKELDYSNFFDNTLWPKDSYENFKKVLVKQLKEISELTKVKETNLINILVCNWVGWIANEQSQGNSPEEGIKLTNFLVKFYLEN